MYISVSYKSISRKDRVMSVGLDLMISPGVCSALPLVTHSDTIT